MKRNAKLATVLLASFLAGAAPAYAEVALDEVVQAGRFVFYRDHADPHKYYYVPDAPRLAAKRDGTPEFTFIKYTKTGGETKGGIVHFLVTWGYTSGELSSAESALKSIDPQAKIAGPVPFKEGTFQVVSATAGEGGLFNRRIVGEGKAPIMPGQKAAVSIALTEEGASLLWESFKNPTSDVSVLFALKFAGVTPAFQAKLKVNWDKVYTHHDIRLQAEGMIKVVKLKAEMQAILDDLRQKGVIQLDVVGENENMQKMLDAVYTHILNMMCEPVPMGAGGAAPAPPVKVPAAVPELPGSHPAWSLDVLSDLVRASGERLRGGPRWEQEQAQAHRTAGFPCDEQSRQGADSYERRAQELTRSGKYNEAADMYQKAYEICPNPLYLYERADILAFGAYEYEKAKDDFEEFLRKTEGLSEYAARRTTAQTFLNDFAEVNTRIHRAVRHYDEGRFFQAIEDFRWAYDRHPRPVILYNLGICQFHLGEQTGNREDYEKSIKYFEAAMRMWESSPNPERFQGDIEDARERVQFLRTWMGEGATVRHPEQAIAAAPARAEQTQADIEATRRAQRQAAAGQRADASATQRPQTQTQEQALSLKPPDLGGGTKPPTGQDLTAGQTQQQTTAQQAGAAGTQAVRPSSTQTTGEQTPSAKPAAQTPPAKPTTPAAKPEAPAPEVKPIVSVSLGYTFKRVKMSGNYEVDMRKRLREDRDIVMSGNISGVFQKYGEDKRFFTVVSLDDPTFQERSVEVILDGQDAEDFKNYINTVSVLFRKQRFTGAPMTGEVKFFADQFAQSGNRLSFRYGRLNEASTEWLTYEYKPKWSFYGGVEWEGEWTKTSDSVLTLSPPVRRRTLEISVDEDNILKNNVKALAIQIRHRIYGKDFLKEVIIDYDKGDPLQARYTYMHEAGSPGYSYKVIWLTTEGREVATDWMSRESPFIYAVFARK